jgi:hypothetical protein
MPGLFHAGNLAPADDLGSGAGPAETGAGRGALSLVLWAGIVVAGRLIAYNWFDCNHPPTRVIVFLSGCPQSNSDEAGGLRAAVMLLMAAPPRRAQDASTTRSGGRSPSGRTPHTSYRDPRVRLAVCRDRIDSPSRTGRLGAPFCSVDLRLLGVGLKDEPIRELAHQAQKVVVAAWR